MVELYDSLLNLRVDIGRDDTIAQLIQTTFSRRYNQDSKPKHYYQLTELCNPMQSYWTRTRRDVRKSKRTVERLTRGYVLQNRAYSWMRNMPEYTSEESNLVGDYVGVSKVVGRYDVRLGDSIMEFKTKPDIPTETRTVFEMYPQDVEQLCFYAALSPRNMKVHYLVFQLDHKPYDMQVFRVEVNDVGAVRNIMRQRINQLDYAIANSDPSRLGKCRYYDFGCDFMEQRVCSCDVTPEIDLRILENAVSVVIDRDKGAELEKYRDKYGKDHRYAFRPWDLLMPRKHFLRCVVGQYSDYEADSEYIAYKESLHKALFRLDALKPLPSELQGLRTNAMSLPVLATWSYMAIMDPELGPQRRRVVPVILKVNKNDVPFTRLPDSYRAEIAIAKVMSSKSLKGVVIVVYPRANDAIQAFIVSSQQDTIAHGEGLLRDAAASLGMAIDKQDIDGLAICPEWVRRECEECPGTCKSLASQRGQPA